jgi:hypothetical protein
MFQQDRHYSQAVFNCPAGTAARYLNTALPVLMHTK